MKVRWSPTAEATVVDVGIVLLHDKREGGGGGNWSSTTAAAEPLLGTRLSSFGAVS
jgi:hypothetical protein